MTDTTTRGIWVAYGTNGVTGSIRHDEDGYSVTMAGADSVAGTYPTLEAAKGALHAHMAPGTARPRFQQH